MALWIVRAHLPADLLAVLKTVLRFEADRFCGVTPPDGRWEDTKAEENDLGRLFIGLGL